MNRLLLWVCLLMASQASTLYSATDPETDADFDLPPLSLLQKTETLPVKDLPNPFVLKHWPILRDSERIRINGETLTNGLDYRIDYYSGRMVFLKTYPPEATVEVTYQTLPFALKREYQRDLFQPIESQTFTPARPDEATAQIEQTPRETPTAEELRVSGSQTFGVSGGTGRSLAQNQALRISVDGNISENVSVVAQLSDQDLPIQGGTEDIQDIDQKLIRITSPTVTATLGDFEGTLGASNLIFFPRALEGVQVEGNFKWGTFSIIPTTIPKGQSASKTIQGQEGRSQYRIDVDGQFIIVKAGSEVVWLNGERMQPGQNNDYIIRDYGDPIIEFTNKHLITSNDVIRVDFEFIPEDLAYQRNLQGISSTLNLPGGRAKLGFGYATEWDIDDPENAFIILTDEDLDALRRNDLDPDGDGRLLIAPQRRTIWGLHSQLDFADEVGLLRYAPNVRGEIAFSALDRNTFSKRDAKTLSRAWQVFANSATERFQLNLDVRSLDADFTPVGASDAGRTRFSYEEQYTQERFDDLYLLGTGGTALNADERSADIDTQLSPVNWLRLTYGLGRTEERFTNSEGLTTLTRRNNTNWGVDFNPKDGILARLYLPQLRREHRESAATVQDVDQFRKTLDTWNILRRLRPFNLNASSEQLESTDLDATDGVNLNRKRDIRTGRIDLVDFKWASINTLYSVEEAFEKEPLLTVDGEALGFGDWQPSTIARTWTVGLFSQPLKWINASTNVSRRVFKVRRGTGADSTTELAEIEFGLTPFDRALDWQVTYELDKKLATERREIYTNINPYTGQEIRPGEGHYVKIDDLHFREDLDEGNYIKLIQNVEDKPVSAVDVRFRLGFQPRRLPFFNRRPVPSDRRSITGEAEPSATSQPSLLASVLKGISGDVVVNITEEQEAPDPSSLYLLRSLQNERTVFGRINQRYRLGFAPSALFNIDVGFITNRLLNKRINNREHQQRSRDWEVSLTVNPTSTTGFRFNWEQRRETEKFSQLNEVEPDAAPISDLQQFERTTTLEVEHKFSRDIRVTVAGSHEFTSDREAFGDEPEARTRTLALENRLTYSFINKARIDVSYRLGFGESEGGIPFTRYNFYEGFSHEVRVGADYRVRKVTDLVFRLTYRLLSTEQRKPEHRVETEVVAEL